MLKALYDYAFSHSLTLPAGCVNKAIKAYISLSSSGALLGVIMTDGEAVLCPDIGSLANGREKSNVLAEKREVVVPGEPTAKSLFFLNALKSGGETEPMLSICTAALEDEETVAQICAELDRHKVKASDRISFKVDGKSILESPKALEWWEDFRRQFRKPENEPTAVCLITGRPAVPLATTAPINGLAAVGGHARGDALICFDKAAFCSYDLKQGANAPVSEEAFSAVKAALERLLADAPVLAGMKFVHWYDRPVAPEDDPILQCGDFTGFTGPEADEQGLNLGMGEDDGQPDEETPAEREQRERSARLLADKVVESVRSGQQSALLDSAYHILLLTGVGGRVMIRRYERGSYEELQKQLRLWHDDLRLTNQYGTAELKSCKLTARLLRLLKHQKGDRKPFRRLEKELSGITQAIIPAILNGTKLPDAVGARALAYIRSQIFAAGAENETNTGIDIVPDGWACQWLKVWLLRKERENEVEEKLMEHYNLNHTEEAYHCGGLMAVYAAIQKMSMREVNAGVVQRYYASASQTPALVLGRLNQLSRHHLDKIKSENLIEKYEKHLAELYTAIGDRVPLALNLERQAYFALGYYQMWAVIKKEEHDFFESRKQGAAQTEQAEAAEYDE